jgi:hypothetical protein
VCDGTSSAAGRANSNSSTLVMNFPVPNLVRTPNETARIEGRAILSTHEIQHDDKVFAATLKPARQKSSSASPPTS